MLDPDDDRFVAMDDTWDIQSAHTIITERNAPQFAAFLLSPIRRLPVIGFTPRDNDVFDASEFILPTLGVAHVALVKNDASWALDELLPRGMNVYGGAARLWWSGVTAESTRYDHPYWPGDRSSRVACRQITDRVIDASVSVAVADTGFQRLLQRQRRSELESLRVANGELRAQLEQTQDAELRRPAEDIAQATTSAIDDLEAAYELIDEQETENERLRREADGLQSQLRAVESERDHWHHTAIGSTGTEVPTPEDALRAEIRQQAMTLSDQTELREFVFGSSLLDTLEQLGDRYREKFVRAAASVVSGSLDALASVENHPLRVSDGASAPQRVRDADGAEAYRAYLEAKTPAARRLHYWVLPSGGVELASVNVHDDFQIPLR